MTDDARIPALQLLLGDCTDDEKRALFYKAFPDSFILLKGDAKTLQDWLSEADSQINEIHDKADGSSPLGVIAVGQVRQSAGIARANIGRIAGLLGLHRNPRR
jgi:hypothetical protein